MDLSDDTQPIVVVEGGKKRRVARKSKKVRFSLNHKIHYYKIGKKTRKHKKQK
uniref:Uncharacterized protein n=1 Tax=viral metagenome TaxID=1070528 RepID=A0A6C0HG21_9ZZZZ